MNDVIAFVMLTAMEIVLGIDNIVFIAIVTSRLPQEQQAYARRIGLVLALVVRIALLSVLNWLLGLTAPLIKLSEIGLQGKWITPEVDSISGKDLIMLFGGLFLIYKSVSEIHKKLDGEHDNSKSGKASLASVLISIVTMDVIFSLDSVITAVGMADNLWVMIVAVIAAVGVMLIFAERISRFVENNPTLKMLALSFLMLIGVMLFAEGIGTHIAKGYIYFAMTFALGVEVLNLRYRSKQKVTEPSRPMLVD